MAMPEIPTCRDYIGHACRLQRSVMRPNGRGKAESAHGPLKALAVLLVAFDPSVAFNPSSVGAPSADMRSASRAIASQRAHRAMLAAPEPSIKDFAVSGGPVIIKATESSSPETRRTTHDSERLRAALSNLEHAFAENSREKPVLLFLPGIELSAYSFHRQIPALAEDFEVRYLSTSVDDRTDFSGLAAIAKAAIEDEHAATGRKTYLVGESLGGALALTVALGESAPPIGLAGLALINPATSVTRSWPSNLQPLIDTILALPPGLSEAAYIAIATPIFAAITIPGNPLQLGLRLEDDDKQPPLKVAAALSRLASSLPLIGELSDVLPLPTLAFRLSMLLQAAKDAEKFNLDKLTLPVQVFASSDDRVLPSVDEGRKLVRRLPNAQLTVLRDSGHAPLLEARVRLAELLRQAQLTQREPKGRKDYVTEFVRPTPAEFAAASERLLPIRKLTSPVFFSTTADGQRIAGLSGLPSLSSGPQAGEESQASTSGHTEESSPPVLFVGNHQLYGFLDIPLIVEEVYRNTGKLVRGLAHPVVFQSTRGNTSNVGGQPGGGNEQATRGGTGFVDYEQFGTVPVSPRTFFKLLAQGENALLYPGGVREAFKSTKQGENYKLFWPPASEGSDFARVAARFGATIVPVAAIGAEEGFEMLLDAEEILELPYFGERAAQAAKDTPVGRPGEQFVSPLAIPTVPGRFYFLFGRPIETHGVDAADKEACAALYSKVRAELEDSLQYVIEKRKEDPWEPVLPRAAVEASWNWTRQAPSFKV